MDSSEGKVIFQDEPVMVIFSEASLSGWGTVCNWSYWPPILRSNRLPRRQPTLLYLYRWIIVRRSVTLTMGEAPVQNLYLSWPA